MRITTGIYRGRLIHGPKEIRPTQDKVRKALFDILGDIEGLSFLELYAGSGAVGLEAASRGAGSLVMVEQGPESLLSIKKNVESLGVENAELFPKDVLLAIQALHKKGRSFDIIFMDPPYYKKREAPRRHLSRSLSGGSGLLGESPDESLTKKALQTLEAYDILAPNGFVVVQHFKRERLPESQGALVLFKQAKYGDTVLSFYRKAEA